MNSAESVDEVLRRIAEHAKSAHQTEVFPARAMSIESAYTRRIATPNDYDSVIWKKLRLPFRATLRVALRRRALLLTI